MSKGDQVFFGGNDDYINLDSYYWVDRASAQSYGAIWIGTPDNVQQGVNDKGLAYDANGLPRVDVNSHVLTPYALRRSIQDYAEQIVALYAMPLSKREES